MAYNKTNWQNTPSTQTPISADNLNKIENQLYAQSTNGVVDTSLTVGSRASGTTTAARSFAQGIDCTASGENSHAEGGYTKATNYYSHAEGLQTEASGSSSHAEGQRTIASGGLAHAEGGYTEASGSESHAEGSYSKATNFSTHAEGYRTVSSGYYSHSEGSETEASGNYSHAEGCNTVASGSSSHVEGFQTEASGSDSHAEGYYSKAQGNHSHAQNCYTIAEGNYQTTLGKYNVSDTTNAVIVGNGTSNTDRSNALTVDWNGNVEIAGSLTDGNGNTPNETEWNQLQTTGTKIATVTIDGTSTDVYAPTGGGGGGASSLAQLDDVTVATPTNGQVLTYDSTASKWKNAESKGGATVMDYSDYQALTPAEKNDGKMRLVKDYPGGVVSADNVGFDNTGTSLPNNVQGAISSINSNLTISSTVPTFASGFVNYNFTDVTKVGKTVSLTISFIANVTPTENIIICTIPEGFRPRVNKFVPINKSAGEKTNALLLVSANGECKIFNALNILAGVGHMTETIAYITN